jgi:heat shock protein HslJ
VPTSTGVWVGTYEGALEFRAFKSLDPVEQESSSTPEASVDSKLVGPGWQLTSIDGSPVPDDAAPISIVFGVNELSGNDGCDDLTTGYRVSIDPGGSPWASLSVGSIDNATTSCGNVSDEERATTFRGLLSDAQDFQIEGDTLTIRSPLGTLTFIDPLALDCPLIRGGTSIGDTGGADPEGAVRMLVDGVRASDRIEEIHYASQGVAYLVVRDDLTIAWARLGSGPDGATRAEFDACAGSGLSAAHPVE